MRTVAVYVRVSTADQSLERQLFEITAYLTARNLGPITIYEDKASGTKATRPAFQTMMRAVRAGKHSTVVVHKLDRFSRSLKDLVSALDELKSHNTGFISINDDLDLTTASGKLLFHVIGAMAEFESSLIKDRVNSGLANAKRKGIKLGRPKLVVDGDTIFRLSATMSMREIASAKGISLASVSRIIKAHSAA